MGAALKAEDVFNPADFQSMEVSFCTIKNLTTRTEPDNLENVQLAELGDKSLTFEIDKNCGAKGHSIMLELRITSPAPKGGAAVVTKFEATTTISNIERDDDGGYRYEVQLVQFEDKSWQQFIGKFQTRQNEINEFLKAVKG